MARSNQMNIPDTMGYTVIVYNGTTMSFAPITVTWLRVSGDLVKEVYVSGPPVDLHWGATNTLAFVHYRVITGQGRAFNHFRFFRLVLYELVDICISATLVYTEIITTNHVLLSFLSMCVFIV